MVKKIVTTGIEGSRKSLGEIIEANKIATTENPVIFSFKSYDLMLQQMSNWSKHLNIPIDDFAVCGIAQTYEKALDAYTNPDKPYVIPSEARFILCTQACLQRNAHVEKFYPKKKYAKIVVDEFDFFNGIVPTFDYQVSRITDLKQRELAKINLSRWVLENYTVADYWRITETDEYNKFFIAHWIESSEAPITFLTSEVLATRLLMLLGFEKKYIASPDYKDCRVRVWSSPLVGRHFFKVFNDEVVWNNLEYDAIITDSVASYFEKNIDTLRVTTISHMGARGSNDWINKNLLTILTHIPPAALAQIKDVFNAFGDDIDQQTVNDLFYRDRLCQAVGRTLGNRGGKVTDLWVHSSIMNGLKNIDSFPYSFDECLSPNLENIASLLSKVKTLKDNTKQHTKDKLKDYTIKSYEQLDDIFQINPKKIIPTADIKEYLRKKNVLTGNGKSIIPVSKVVKHFNLKLKNVRFGKDTKQCVVGLDYKNN